MKKHIVGVISLGCDKNRVDTEKMLAILAKEHEITSDIEKADVIVINTCAFLRASREEAISEILSAARLKEKGKLKKIVVTGCLPQKYSQELIKELKEADAFLGTNDYDKINDVIHGLFEKEERVNAVGCGVLNIGRERILTTSGYAYLKIADGCSNHCTYCLIPKIRGAYRSTPPQELINEVKEMGNVGELILVAQDTARYGADLSPDITLTSLIRELSAIKGVRGIRLLYCYPENITEELINEFRVNPKLIKYIDIPFQHADDRILKLMNRKGTGEDYLRLVKKLKAEVPGIAIRSTFIAGFPTETEENFNNLVNFIKEARLFNAGFFKYSREEDTAAYNLDGQIPESVKTKRVKKLYSVQKAAVKEIGKTMVGKTFKVLAEGFDRGRICYFGRAYFNAPDIDGKIYFFSAEEVKNGEFYDVKILQAKDYDLIGERT